MYPHPAPWLFLVILTCAVAAPVTVAAERPNASTHWAFQSVAEVRPPSVKNTGWVRNPIDAFIAARHEAAGVTPAPEAPRRVLVRRLFLDLTGLPPSPHEVEAFVNDRSPDAFDKLADRLLVSPRHAERYARHWLDLVRWAETEGYESNHSRPYAWRYRDYVVQSFLRDKPYDRFVTEQLAGDELEPYSDENLIATGFLAAARLSSNEEDKARQRNDVLVDVVNATSSALLGITLHCAQCHNHKLEPFRLSDYYRFQGFFVRGHVGSLALRDPKAVAAYEAARPEGYDAAVRRRDQIYEEARARLVEEVRAELSAEMLRALDTPAERRTDEEERLARQADLRLQFSPNRIERVVKPKSEYLRLGEEIRLMEQRMPDRPQTFGFYSPATSPHAVAVLPARGFYPLPYTPTELARARPYALRGGEVHERGRALDPDWPELFGPTPKGDVEKRPRSALAAWLTRKDHPLTARVWVNRLWQYHFGTGLVATPNDFGLKGAPPSHPELLDWLAGELVRSGWSTRHVNRLIVTSATYRQAAHGDRTNATLLVGWPVRRLEAEAVRDAMLSVSGELNGTVGGPSVPTEDAARRSLYLYQKREVPPAVQGLFDGPSAMAQSCARRFVTTTPQQALYLLNSTFVAARAKALAERVSERACENQELQIEAAFARVLGRSPDEAERDAARKFFCLHGGDGARPLTDFCQALLNVNEFVYLE